MQEKFYAQWHLTLLVLVAATLSLVLVQKAVFADWQAPVDDPGDNTGINTPLVSDNETSIVNVYHNDIIDVKDLTVSTLTATSTIVGDSITVDDLTVNATVDVTATDSEIDVTSSSILSPPVVGGENVYAIKATGGKNTQNNAYTYGLYATTLSNSGSYPSYAVAGISENAGGVGVYGVGTAGWAGYFAGPVGISGAVTLGSGTTASGNYSLAGGDSSTASGAEAVAFGFSTEASGTDSFVTGNESYASGFASHALGMYATASGDFSSARGYSVVASGDYSTALGSGITMSGTDSVGIGLDYSAALAVTGDNVLAIMGGDVGIGVDPSYKLHLLGDYYQDGMMQVQPTTALISTENLIYGNSPSGTSNSAHLLRLQSNGTDKFRVTNLGAVVAASSLTATQGTFSSNLSVSGSASLNGGGTFTNTLGAKTGGIISFNGSSGSYFDFNDDSGAKAPTCKSTDDGKVYNFTVNKVLCYCDGTSWISMVNGKADSLCSAK
jgi:uncharacterized membrane protein